MTRPVARSLRQSAKALVANAGLARLQTRSLAMARGGVKVLEAHRGALPKGVEADISAYAAERLGSRRHAPWLHLYALVQGGFQEGWLPETYFIGAAGPRVNGEYHHIARHRAANGLVFDAAPFPDLGYWVNGIFYGRDYRVVAPGDVAAYLAKQADKVVFKADRSGWGHGLHFLRASEVSAQKLARMGNAVCQRHVEQHGFFGQFELPSVATLRAVTAIDERGAASVRGLYLKLGRAGGTHIRADDQVRIAVDPQTGLTAGEGFMADWRPVEVHPDTGASLAGLEVPSVAAACERVLRLHSQNPLARLVSWDLAVEADGGIAVLEWEGGVVSFCEATQGPCFTDLGWDRFHDV